MTILTLVFLIYSSAADWWSTHLRQGENRILICFQKKKNAAQTDTAAAIAGSAEWEMQSRLKKSKLDHNIFLYKSVKKKSNSNICSFKFHHQASI